MRCFVAVLPPPDTAAQIERSVDQLVGLYPGARRVATANVHLTLSFIGSLSENKAQSVAATLAQIAPDQFPECEWVLDRVGLFKEARVLWLGGAPCPALDAYVRVVQSTLKQLQVKFDTRPFVPHVTVLRRFSTTTPLPQFQLHVPWPLSRPLLMESLSANGTTRYQVVQ